MQTQGGAATTTGQAGAGAKLSTEQRTQITSVIKETARSARDERELLDFGRHPRAARRELPCVAAASS